MRLGAWVALAAFLSLVGLGWWVLVWGWSWTVLGVGLFWLVVGAFAGFDPEAWERRRR